MKYFIFLALFLTSCITVVVPEPKVIMREKDRPFNYLPYIYPDKPIWVLPKDSIPHYDSLFKSERLWKTDTCYTPRKVWVK